MDKTGQSRLSRPLVIALVVPVLIVIVSLWLFAEKFNGEIAFAYKEIEGIHEVQSYYEHMDLVQRIRGLRQIQIAGQSGLQADIGALQKQLLIKIGTSRQKPHADWLDVKTELENIDYDIRQLYAVKNTPADSLRLFERYSQLTLKFIVMLKKIADNSNLSLDPELDSHLLEELVVDRMPGIIEHIAIMRGLSAYVAENPGQYTKVLPRLQYHLTAVIYEKNNLYARYTGYLQQNSTVKKLQSTFGLMQTSIDAYIEYMQAGLKKRRFTDPARAVFKQGSVTIEVAAGLVRGATAELMARLAERARLQQTLKYLIVVGIGLATLLFVSIVLYFFFRHRQASDSLSATQIALASAQSRNTAIINTVIDGIISIDDNGVVHDFNPSAEKIFGYTFDEVVGRKINMLMPEPYSAEHDGYMQNYLHTGQRKIIGNGREVEGRRKDGTVFPMDLAVNEMQIEGQRFFTGIVRDITDRKRIETMKNEFISTVSHEIRTPLTSIRGSLGLINGGAVGEIPNKMKDLLAIAGKNTERLLLLINDILDLQKIESGKMAFKYKVMDIMPFIEQAVADNKTYATQYGVNFDISSHEDGFRVFADRDRLMQVLANLLSNAAKFSPAGSRVQVAVARHEGSVRVSVSDHGPGIPETFRQHIFEKFSQLDSTDSRNKGGTGLGLSISKLIIEKHGGRINYLSKQGVGTTFYFELPELISQDVDMQPVQRGQLQEHVPCVLIVEDDQDVAALLRRMLAEAGFDSDVAYSAAEARSLLEKNLAHYQVMTLDITLPDEDGLSLLKSMRDEPKTRHLPVVIVSVKADEGKIELNGGAIGVIDWLSKPIDQQRLIKTIEQTTTSMALPRVLHVEDDEDIHKIVSLMLQGICELVWTTTIEASKQILQEEKVDLVLLDIELPDGSGLELLETIEHTVVPPRVVIFSANEVPHEYAGRVNAVLTKSATAADELLKNILSFIKR